jgi:putative hydrolase of the HAD superfamily
LRAVVFDLVGTLVLYDGQGDGRVLPRMANELGVDPAAFAEAWRDAWEPRFDGTLATSAANVRHVAQIVGATPSDAAVERAVGPRVELMRKLLTPRAGAVAILSEMKNAGLKLGLISDCSPEIPLLWGETAFAGLIDAALFSCTERMCKPDRRLYERVAERLGVEPGECLYVGDGGSDELSGAENAGLTAVLIRGADDMPDEYRAEAFRWKGRAIDSLDEVLGLVRLME